MVRNIKWYKINELQKYNQYGTRTADQVGTNALKHPSQVKHCTPDENFKLLAKILSRNIYIQQQFLQVLKTMCFTSKFKDIKLWSIITL